MGIVILVILTSIQYLVGIAIIRTLLYVARPGVAKLGKISDTVLFRDVEQYPKSVEVPNMLIIAFRSPIYFANAGYMRGRIGRYIDEEIEKGSMTSGNELQYMILDLSGL